MGHNCYKLNKLFDIGIKYILWCGGILLLLISFVSKEPINFNIISRSVGICSILFSVLWGQFSKKWWKKDFFQKILPDKFKTPVIEGRWEGYFIRERNKHDFVIEVKQTFTEISCHTYSKHSCSDSILSEIIYKNAGNFQLMYYWEGETENTSIEKTHMFRGITILKINNDRLEGEYFTNRDPQTKGKISVKYKQSELRKTFRDSVD